MRMTSVISSIVSMTSLISRFAMHIVNGAGPAPHQEQPELVNKHIAKFIKGDSNANIEGVMSSDEDIDEVFEFKHLPQTS